MAPGQTSATRTGQRQRQALGRSLIQLGLLALGVLLFVGIRAILPPTRGPVSLVVSNYGDRPLQVELMQGDRSLARFGLAGYTVHVIDDCHLVDDAPLVLQGLADPSDGWPPVRMDTRLIVVDAYPGHSVVRHVQAP